MKLSGQVGIDTRNKLKRFPDVVIYSLYPDSTFLFSSVIVRSIMENGPTDFHKILRMC